MVDFRSHLRINWVQFIPLFAGILQSRNYTYKSVGRTCLHDEKECSSCDHLDHALRARRDRCVPDGTYRWGLGVGGDRQLYGRIRCGLQPRRTIRTAVQIGFNDRPSSRVSLHWPRHQSAYFPATTSTEYLLSACRTIRCVPSIWRARCRASAARPNSPCRSLLEPVRSF